MADSIMDWENCFPEGRPARIRHALGFPNEVCRAGVGGDVLFGGAGPTANGPHAMKGAAREPPLLAVQRRTHTNNENSH